MDTQDDLPPRQYFSYLLRLWAAGEDAGNPVWQASLEDPLTGKRSGFPTLEALYRFLQEQIHQQEQAAGETRPERVQNPQAQGHTGIPDSGDAQ